VGPFPLRPFGRGAKALLANPLGASPKGAQGKRTHYPVDRKSHLGSGPGPAPAVPPPDTARGALGVSPPAA